MLQDCTLRGVWIVLLVPCHQRVRVIELEWRRGTLFIRRVIAVCIDTEKTDFMNPVDSFGRRR